MNSWSSSSVVFLQNITGQIFIVSGGLALVAILLFTARYYLSPEDGARKREVWIKKVATTCTSFLLIAVLVGTSLPSQIFETIANGANGTNSEISKNAGNSFDIGGTQYSLEVKRKELEDLSNNQILESEGYDIDKDGHMISDDELNKRMNKYKNIPEGMSEQAYSAMWKEISDEYSHYSNSSDEANWFRSASVDEKREFIDKKINEKAQAGIANRPSNLSDWLAQTEQNRRDLANSDHLLQIL